MTFDAFVSYSNRDKATADAACAALEAAGIRCWIAPRDVVPGSDWGSSIIAAIDRCRAMVLIFSSSANESPQIRNEVVQAVNRSVPVIPVRIENVEPTKALAYHMGAVHWLDALTPPLEQHLQRLAESVTALLQINADKPAGVEASGQTARATPPAARAAPFRPMSTDSAYQGMPSGKEAGSVAQLGHLAAQGGVLPTFEAILLFAFGAFLVCYAAFKLDFWYSEFRIVIGWLLLISGIVALIRTSSSRPVAGFSWPVVYSTFTIVVAGVLLSVRPAELDIDCIMNSGRPDCQQSWSALSLTLIAYFTIAGIVLIVRAVQRCDELIDQWIILPFANGALDLVLAFIAILVTKGRDYYDWDILAALVGVHLLAAGAALLAMSLVTPKATVRHVLAKPK